MSDTSFLVDLHFSQDAPNVYEKWSINEKNLQTRIFLDWFISSSMFSINAF